LKFCRLSRGFQDRKVCFELGNSFRGDSRIGSMFFVFGILGAFFISFVELFVFLGRTLVTWGYWSFLAECLGIVLCSNILLGEFCVFKYFVFLLAQIWISFTCVIQIINDWVAACACGWFSTGVRSSLDSFGVIQLVGVFS